jgi:hypothetical protein
MKVETTVLRVLFTLGSLSTVLGLCAMAFGVR